MLYDLEESSQYSKPYDMINIISGQPNKGLIIDGQIINTVIADGLRGEIF